MLTEQRVCTWAARRINALRPAKGHIGFRAGVASRWSGPPRDRGERGGFHGAAAATIRSDAVARFPLSRSRRRRDRHLHIALFYGKHDLSTKKHPFLWPPPRWQLPDCRDDPASPALRLPNLPAPCCHGSLGFSFIRGTGARSTPEHRQRLSSAPSLRSRRRTPRTRPAFQVEVREEAAEGTGGNVPFI